MCREVVQSAGPGARLPGLSGPGAATYWPHDFGLLILPFCISMPSLESEDNNSTYFIRPLEESRVNTYLALMTVPSP